MQKCQDLEISRVKCLVLKSFILASLGYHLAICLKIEISWGPPPPSLFPQRLPWRLVNNSPFCKNSIDLFIPVFPGGVPVNPKRLVVSLHHFLGCEERSVALENTNISHEILEEFLGCLALRIIGFILSWESKGTPQCHPPQEIRPY